VPADFVDYGVPANRPADFFFEAGEASTTDTLADPALGAYNYRVCNRDRLFVYSNCNSGFWNGAGWLDSAVAPTSGWTHQLGGAVLLLPGIIPGNRIGVATNVPSLAVIDAATGDRTFDPVPLSALPAAGTPAAQIGDGRLLLFAADTGGGVTAFDLGAGTIAWSSPKTGESFVAGVTGIIRRTASPGYQAAYDRDILFLASTTGRVLAVDCATGATLWSVDTGVAAGVRGKPYYDSVTNRLFVATNGGGVLAYDIGLSNPASAPPLAAGFVNPGGTYRLSCGRVPSAATDFACVDVTGVLRVLTTATGNVRATLATGVSSPSALAGIGGATPGFVVSNASRVVRILAAGSPPVLTPAGQWSPGLTLSPSQTIAARGAIYVGASDRRLHKLAIADASDTGAFVSINPQPASVLLGPPGVDVVNEMFFFGTDDGRLWAVPVF
jgi:outer membrane protein assembly factor BamB